MDGGQIGNVPLVDRTSRTPRSYVSVDLDMWPTDLAVQQRHSRHEEKIFRIGSRAQMSRHSDDFLGRGLL
jgi:hypothetical protein